MSMTASCTQFSVQVPAGTVLRVAAMDVHHLLDGPVTSGANVIINRYNPDGSLGEIGQISHLDDDWWSLFTMPDIQGLHEFKLEVQYNNGEWHGVGYCEVRG